MKIGIIVGSVREDRAGLAVGSWVAAGAKQVEGVEATLIDLKEFDVPLLTSATLPMMANKQYESPAVQAWSAAVDACDAYVFVTPEYNHSVPGAFKNAVDSIGPELVGKAVAFVAYGADGGVRAVEHWRTIVANFSMYDVRAQVSLNRFTEFGEDGSLNLQDRRAGELETVFEQLVTTAKALAPKQDELVEERGTN